MQYEVYNQDQCKLIVNFYKGLPCYLVAIHTPYYPWYIACYGH